MGKFTDWYNAQPRELQRYLDRLPIYTWNEYIWTVVTAFVVGVLVGLAF